MGLFRKIFGSYSDRQVKKLRKIADVIDTLAPKYKAMTNEELAHDCGAERKACRRRYAG